MTPMLCRFAVLGAATASMLALSAATASAAPACDDAIAGVLHAAHDTTGDPVGLIHEVEETYCSVG